MNKEQFSNNFQQLKSAILDRWNKLTDEDLRQINGRYELFITKIQDKYGISRDVVEEQIRNFAPNVRFDRERDRDLISSKRIEEEEGSSVGKWLLAAGIPFLFLLGYLGTHYNTPITNDTTTAPMNSNQTLYTRAPATAETDATLAQNVRQALSGMQFRDLRDLRVESSSGVVTLTGTVRTEDQKASITRLVEQISGVVRVNNNIAVKS